MVWNGICEKSTGRVVQFAWHDHPGDSMAASLLLAAVAS
jgi:hypothetical protein